MLLTLVNFGCPTVGRNRGLRDAAIAAVEAVWAKTLGHVLQFSRDQFLRRNNCAVTASSRGCPLNMGLPAGVAGVLQTLKLAGR